MSEIAKSDGDLLKTNEGIADLKVVFVWWGAQICPPSPPTIQMSVNFCNFVDLYLRCLLRMYHLLNLTS